ncbi:MAG: hypothetical protein ACRENY_04060 [Candidatus Dormibacteria bacterium]
MAKPNLAAAAQFLSGSARIVDWRHFQRVFEDGAPGPVRDAVAAYRNPDGGFGHGLEPDGRTPASQPAAVEVALRILHESDSWDPDLAAGACDWLGANAPPGGGAAFAEPTVAGWPHAPWWEPTEAPLASVATTGQIVATLHSRQAEHPWLAQATDLMWERISRLTAPGAYDMLGVLRFLDRVPDRRRADAVFRNMGHLLIDQGIVSLDPDAEGEVHGPLEFAPTPESLAFGLFDSPTITSHLEHLAAAQREDGGWSFNWLAWSPAAAAAWRGFVTVEALARLRAYGQI